MHTIDDVLATRIGQLQTCRPLKMMMPLRYTGIIEIAKAGKGDIGYIRTFRIMLTVVFLWPLKN